MEHGIDESDPFGVAALLLGQSVAHRFDRQRAVGELLDQLLTLDIPLLPNADVVEVLRPIDELLDRIESEPLLLELVWAMLRLGRDTPPRTDVAERLFRSVLWTMLRHDRAAATPDVLAVLRAATPGARFRPADWPRNEFFSTVVALVYLGGDDARSELEDLLDAARDLDYHDLAPILDWYLDHRHEPPLR